LDPAYHGKNRKYAGRLGRIAQHKPDKLLCANIESSDDSPND
jgi:hypothetical protein